VRKRWKPPGGGRTGKKSESVPWKKKNESRRRFIAAVRTEATLTRSVRDKIGEVCAIGEHHRPEEPSIRPPLSTALQRKENQRKENQKKSGNYRETASKGRACNIRSRRKSKQDITA